MTNVIDNHIPCEKIKLSQIFNVFNPKFSFYIGSITLGCVILIIGVFKLFTVITAALFWFFAVMIVTSRSPDEIELYGRFIKFSDYVDVRPNPFVKSGFWWLRVDYTVTDPVIIKYEQNAIEKRFNVGHITVMGDARFETSRDIEKIPERDTFVIYGVKNFEEFKERFIDN